MNQIPSKKKKKQFVIIVHVKIKISYERVDLCFASFFSVVIKQITPYTHYPTFMTNNKKIDIQIFRVPFASNNTRWILYENVDAILMVVSK